MLRKVGADHISFHNCHIFLAVLIGQLSAKSLRLRQSKIICQCTLEEGMKSCRRALGQSFWSAHSEPRLQITGVALRGLRGGAGMRTRASGPSSTANLQIRIRRRILVCEMTTSLPTPTTSQGEDQVGLCE